LACFIVFTAITWNDLSQTTAENTPIKDIPVPKMTSKFSGPTLKFLFCYSWGYRKVFDQYADAIQQKFPHLKVLGDNYPPPHFRALACQVFSLAKIAFIVLILAGINPFQSLNMPTPNIYSWCLSNKIYACLMLFFVGNAIEGQLISTGAFEISFNDVPVWSKLESGRIPSPQEMFQIIENHMKMVSTSNSQF